MNTESGRMEADGAHAVAGEAAIAASRDAGQRGSPQMREPGEAELRAHRNMVIWLLGITVFTCLGFGAMLWQATPAVKGNTEHVPVLLAVVIAGALGGFVSRLRRLYAFEDLFTLKTHAISFGKINWYLIAYSTIPPVVGAIAAAIIYVVFAGQMVTGPLFPDFVCRIGKDQCMSLVNVLGYWTPDDPADYAKCVVWGFVAGFSERFVDSVLGKFAGGVD